MVYMSILIRVERSISGGGYSICDSSYPPKVNICLPGIYKIEIFGTGTSDTPAILSLVELCPDLSNTNSIPIGSISSAGASQINGSFMVLRGGGGMIAYAGVYNFCHITKESPASFALRLDPLIGANLGGSSKNVTTVEGFATFGPGTTLIIQRVAPCHCSSHCEDCCDCCPLIPPQEATQTITNIFTANPV